MRLILLIAALGIVTLSGFSAPAGTWEKQGPNVRVMRHQDNSKTVFRRTPGSQSLVKKNVGVDGKVRYSTHYRMDKHGNPRSCKIYNASKLTLFYVTYGYDRFTGRLVGERMFDPNLKDPKTGKDSLVMVMYYKYDAQGKQQPPVRYVFQKGQTIEEYLGGQKSSYEENPFEEERKLANPNAKPLGK